MFHIQILNGRHAVSSSEVYLGGTDMFINELRQIVEFYVRDSVSTTLHGIHCMKHYLQVSYFYRATSRCQRRGPHTLLAKVSLVKYLFLRIFYVLFELNKS